MATGPALQLTYFDVPGRAEAIRKTLSIANLPFADTRISQETFRDQKASFPYGAVPVLDVDGQRFAEMHAILRYAGRLTGLYPLQSEPVAAALVDEVLDAFEDLFTRLLIPSMMEKDAGKKQQMRLALLAGPLPEALRRLDARLAKIATYPVFQEEPARVFVHDVLVWDFVEWMRSTTLDFIPTTLIDGFKTMVAIHDKVDAIKSPNQIARATAHSPAVTSPGPLPKKLKLSYFDMPGRAEPIRLALHMGGIEFEDERLSYEEFLERKHALPYGHLPVLVIDGVTLAQSTAILRYAGSFAGLYPTQGGDALAAMRIDEVLSHVSELFYALDPWFGEQDPEQRRDLGVSLAAETIPRSLEGLDARLAGWKGDKPAGPFVGGDHPTIADIVVFVLMQFLELEFFPATAVDDAAAKPTDAYEHLVSVTDAVGALPRVADWYAHHGEPTA